MNNCGRERSVPPQPARHAHSVLLRSHTIRSVSDLRTNSPGLPSNRGFMYKGCCCPQRHYKHLIRQTLRLVTRTTNEALARLSGHGTIAADSNVLSFAPSSACACYVAQASPRPQHLLGYDNLQTAFMPYNVSCLSTRVPDSKVNSDT